MSPWVTSGLSSLKKTLSSLKKKFYFVVYFTFLVTKTKIRNREAVFQADSPIKGSRDLAW